MEFESWINKQKFKALILIDNIDQISEKELNDYLQNENFKNNLLIATLSLKSK